MDDKLNKSPMGEALPDEALDKVAGGFNPFTRCNECGAEDAPHEVTEGVVTFRLCDSCYKKYQEDHPASV